MSAEADRCAGRLFDNQHGVIGEVEGGSGQIQRYADGKPTRFNFKKSFSRAPNLQITPILTDRQGAFHSFYLYLLHPSGGPPVDKDGFYLGIFSDTGNKVDFQYFANSIFEA
ncbi:uncharacterized protein MAM_07253 [Metarhizium album ARSEF 1941]|uniref:Uncharacterized protein n=1 Tax=Metarhizium album (strain ARSEF 1941) TaxID=1081103 RepID=A0A0B2WME2_METAS|nr:uncharacterized protein MAM_07253 [Metarhizium album ARSEF 1941]KHN94834.1 hypothetical protein MAM_07253 [Metarhizium album ARSEF 1941]